MPTHAEQRILPYTQEEMFNLVADVESYPRFLPWVTRAHVFDRQENQFLADVDIGYKFIQDTYRSEVCLSPYERVDVRYIHGPFRYLNNHWIFSTVGEHAVAIDFFIDFEFKSSLMQGLMQSIFSEAVRRMITAFEAQAKVLYGK